MDSMFSFSLYNVFINMFPSLGLEAYGFGLRTCGLGLDLALVSLLTPLSFTIPVLYSAAAVKLWRYMSTRVVLLHATAYMLLRVYAIARLSVCHRGGSVKNA